MTFSRWYRAVLVVWFLGTIATAPAALARTIHLDCQRQNDFRVSRLTIDTRAQTVEWWTYTVPATFTSTTVTWEIDVPPNMVETDFTLDRESGELTEQTDRHSRIFTCTRSFFQ